MSGARAIPEVVQRVLAIAIQIAVQTPRKRNKWAYSAYVSWAVIYKLRETLTECGVDLDKVRRGLEADLKTK